LGPAQSNSTAAHTVATILVATRNRPASLFRTLQSIAKMPTQHKYEVLVVDDGSSPPIGLEDLPDIPSLRLLATRGVGPAAARNVGFEAAAGEIVLVTDDDVIVDECWAETACRFLESHPNCVGVEGSTSSPDYDPLYAYSVRSDGPGAYLTCNVAYRRPALAEVGGFSTSFPHPHCEDVDLAYRILEVGPIGYCPEMTVVHPPRPQSIMQLIGRARMVSSEIQMIHRHPRFYQTRAPLPRWSLPVAGLVRFWFVQLMSNPRQFFLAPHRLARLGLIATGQVVVASAIVLRGLATSTRNPLPKGGEA
jgi:GT2 family glycosyltransferase